MKKKTFRIVSVILLGVLGFSGCGSNGDSQPIQEENAIEEVVEEEVSDVDENPVSEEADQEEPVEEEQEEPVRGITGMELADDEEIFVNVFDNYVLKYKPDTVRASYSGFGSIYYYSGETDGIDDCNFLSIGYFADRSVSELSGRSDYTALSSGDMFYPDSLGTEAYLSTLEETEDDYNSVNHTIIVNYNGGELQIFCPIRYKEESTREAMEQTFDDIIGSITNDPAMVEEAKAQGGVGVQQAESLIEALEKKYGPEYVAPYLEALPGTQSEADSDTGKTVEAVADESATAESKPSTDSKQASYGEPVIVTHDANFVKELPDYNFAGNYLMTVSYNEKEITEYDNGLGGVKEASGYTVTTIFYQLYDLEGNKVGDSVVVASNLPYILELDCYPIYGTDCFQVVAMNFDNTYYFTVDPNNGNVTDGKGEGITDTDEPAFADINKWGRIKKCDAVDGYFVATADFGQKGYVDKNGNIIRMYTDATQFSSNGYAFVSDDGKNYDLIDSDFNVIKANALQAPGLSLLGGNMFSKGDYTVYEVATE